MMTQDSEPPPTGNFGKHVVVESVLGKDARMWGGFKCREDARKLRNALAAAHRDKSFRIARGADHKRGKSEKKLTAQPWNGPVPSFLQSIGE